MKRPNPSSGSRLPQALSARHDPQSYSHTPISYPKTLQPKQAPAAAADPEVPKAFLAAFGCQRFGITLCNFVGHFSEGSAWSHSTNATQKETRIQTWVQDAKAGFERSKNSSSHANLSRQPSFQTRQTGLHPKVQGLGLAPSRTILENFVPLHRQLMRQLILQLHPQQKRLRIWSEFWNQGLNLSRRSFLLHQPDQISEVEGFARLVW